jgi:hypothetical protein
MCLRHGEDLIRKARIEEAGKDSAKGGTQKFPAFLL